MSSSIKSLILKVTRRTKNGFTAGEIYDRVVEQMSKENPTVLEYPLYSSVRARVAEMLGNGELVAASVRKDPVSGRDSTTYRRPNQSVLGY